MGIEARWHDATIEILRGAQEREAVIAFVTDAAPGLAVNATVGTDADVARYTITHIASGHRLGDCMFARKQSAMRAVESLAPLTDWRRSGDELKADARLHARVAETLRGEALLA